MSKTAGNILRQDLLEYLDTREVILHPLYEVLLPTVVKFPGMDETDEMDEMEVTLMRYCCSSRPILIATNNKKNTVIENQRCYSHALFLALHSKVKISVSVAIHEVKHLQERDCALRVLLDSLSCCPFIGMKSLFRACIVVSAYKHRELFKDVLDVSSLFRFAKFFGVPPAMTHRAMKLSDKKIEDRLLSKYRARGGRSKKGVTTTPDTNQADEATSCAAAAAPTEGAQDKNQDATTIPDGTQAAKANSLAPASKPKRQKQNTDQGGFLF